MMDFREALTLWNRFRLTGLYRTLVKRWMSIYMKKMGHDIPEYGIESLPMGRN